MNIKICEQDLVFYYHKKFNFTKIISLIDSDFKLEKIIDDHLIKNFDDIPYKIFGYVEPKMDDIIDVLNFSKSFNDTDNILIHCQMGISRSPAIAIGVLCQHGYSPKEAYDYVRLIRSECSPNTLIIKLIDEFLNLKGELIKLFFKETL